MYFNIYYMNFSKVYEIKMMFSNIIQTAKTVEESEESNADAGLETKISGKLWKLLSGEVSASVNGSSADSQKILDTFKVTTTKSVILSEVIDKCADFKDVENLHEGHLVHVGGVKLSLENETELRSAKIFAGGTFKGLKIPEAKGLDINNIFNALFKDYSYKLKGEINESEEKILVRIPFSFENEFESSYSVDDLFIGTVSIIGIYKGKMKVAQLKNSFEFFQEIGQMQNGEEDDQAIHHSQYSKKQALSLVSENDKDDYHYIDILAIVQSIEIETPVLEKKPRRGKQR